MLDLQTVMGTKEGLDGVTAPQGLTATASRGTVWAGFGLFFGYEVLITLSSLAFVAIGALLQSGAEELIAWSSPLAVVCGVLAATLLKAWIAVGLYRKQWRAWVTGLGVVLLGALTTLCQLLGVLTDSPIWWLLVRFESGGNFGLIWSVIVSNGLVVKLMLVLMLCVYSVVAHQLWTRRDTLVHRGGRGSGIEDQTA
jgi:hypothetical protein